MRSHKLLAAGIAILLSSFFALVGSSSATAQTAVTPTIDLVDIETNALTPAFSVTTTQATVGSPTDYYLRSMRFTPADWTSELCPGALTSQPLSTCGATLSKNGVVLTDVTVTKAAGPGLMVFLFPAAQYPAGWSLPAGTIWKLEFVAGAFRTSDEISASIVLNQYGDHWITDRWWGSATLDTAARVLLQNHVVTFNANGGSGSLARQLGRSATPEPLRSIGSSISRSGYTFEGWATSLANANAGTVAYADGANFPFRTSQGTLYAVWNRLASSSTGTLAETGADVSNITGLGVAGIATGLLALLLQGTRVRNRSGRGKHRA